MRKLWAVGVLVGALACSRPSKTEEAADSPDTALLGLVPADATLVILLEPPRRVVELLGAYLSEPRRKKLEDDVVAYFRTKTGLDVRDLQRAVVFISAQGDMAAILPNVSSAGKGSPQSGFEFMGERLTLVSQNDMLYIGHYHAVRAALDVASRASASFTASTDVGSLARGRGGAWFTAFVGKRSLATLPGAAGLRIARVTVGEQGVRGVALGDDAAVQTAANALLGEVAKFRQETQRWVDETKAQDQGGMDFVALLSGHYNEEMLDSLKIRTERGRLLVELETPAMCGMLAPAAIGIAAAVAIPAFMKLARKSQRPEAVKDLQKLYEGARAYAEERRIRGGRASFPPKSVGPTPPLNTCCTFPDRQCRPNLAFWIDPTWQALKFTVDDPFYYSYTYQSNGSEFSVRANGDLDCDGVYSTFEMVGRILPDGTVAGAGGMFKDQELE